MYCFSGSTWSSNRYTVATCKASSLSMYLRVEIVCSVVSQCITAEVALMFVGEKRVAKS